jgi:hypothetical protein
LIKQVIIVSKEKNDFGAVLETKLLKNLEENIKAMKYLWKVCQQVNLAYVMIR